jgi:hypothetical protein
VESGIPQKNKKEADWNPMRFQSAVKEVAEMWGP